jgi:hypothetical protein
MVLPRAQASHLLFLLGSGSFGGTGASSISLWCRLRLTSLGGTGSIRSHSGGFPMRVASGRFVRCCSRGTVGFLRRSSNGIRGIRCGPSGSVRRADSGSVMVRGAVEGGRESLRVVRSFGKGGGKGEVGAVVRCQNSGSGNRTPDEGDNGGDSKLWTRRCPGTPTVARKVPSTLGSTDRLASSVKRATVKSGCRSSIGEEERAVEFLSP